MATLRLADLERDLVAVAGVVVVLVVVVSAGSAVSGLVSVTSKSVRVSPISRFFCTSGVSGSVSVTSVSVKVSAQVFGICSGDDSESGTSILIWFFHHGAGHGHRLGLGLGLDGLDGPDIA